MDPEIAKLALDGLMKGLSELKSDIMNAPGISSKDRAELLKVLLSSYNKLINGMKNELERRERQAGKPK
jgi:hypothetical protein